MHGQKEGAKPVGVRTNFHFQFITTPTSDTPGTSLVLHFNSKRYIFGEITEGTQRACVQRGVGLRKVRGLFLSGKTLWNNGGLIGLILSMADVQQSEIDEDTNRRPRLHIHAGPKQLHSFACARRFVFRTGMPLSVHEVDVRKSSTHLNPIHEDEHIRVWALPVEDRSTIPPPQDISDDSGVDEFQLERDQKLRNEVINNMFDSDWRRDHLVQAKLKDIRLPAVVWVRDPETKTLITYPVFDISKTTFTPDTEVLVRSPWPASTVQELPPATGLPETVTMSYIVKGHPQRGNFDAAKAKALGLRPGPKYAKLVAGETVESDDGKETTITPQMVLSPTRPGRGFAVFDIPSAGYLEEFERQLDSRADWLLEGVETAVWMTKGKVLQAERFHQLLHKFKDLKHIISDPHLCNDYIAYDSTAMSSARLSQIAPAFFSVPRFDNSRAYRTMIDKSMVELGDVFEKLQIVPAKRGLKVHVEPNLVIDEGEVTPSLDLDSFSAPMEPAVQEVLPDGVPVYHAPIPEFKSAMDLDEPEIVTLGTGSAAPSKYRNVSSLLLRMPKGMGNYLFDCGEGTLGQLKRLYHAEQLDDILCNLRGIWISHLHADHHLGTVSVLKHVFQTVRRLAGPGHHGRRPPPYLFSEINMIDYLDDYESVMGIPTDLLCTPIACDPHKGLFHRRRHFEIQSDLYIRELRTVKVSHCHGAQAVSVTFKNGFKFSYSGDCRPSEAFCEIGANSDVLVHEATFDDGMEGDAMAKKHSTTGEAVGVALGMGAKNLILTHFSQRYQKIPVFSSVRMPERVSEEDLLDDVDDEMINTNANGNDDCSESEHLPAQNLDSSAWIQPDSAVRDLNIAVAFDLMHMRVSQIKHMKELFPAISKMFEIEEEKRDRLRMEAAAQQKADLESRKLKRLQAMEANRKKMDAGNKQRQMDRNREKKNRRAKRKEGEGETANMSQGLGVPAGAQKRDGDGAAADHSALPVILNASGAEPTTNNYVEVGKKRDTSTREGTNAKRAQAGDGNESQMLDMPAQDRASADPNLAEQRLGNGKAASTGSQSPLKRRKTE
ncbi:uncharacterized protein Z519_11347 [Cladophialophora bantiana CBS 173.52]|uniref:ribonuclease Z n=1 Tax=Cladophialophora bantiana (strain ATCC 10958 / CBS 173.52 / CDC B-1940 / NIH 8579) TaxID=1442370 RepID=A0A0D2EDM6_CLAB1|nr:uncharacterized protein Z519_11347 [Cladophialophora bantiana CBS 173.52]KIW88236.1 hypothetical protein Z519_11347 [Cladophialophora bantiana CBS 173.52]